MRKIIVEPEPEFATNWLDLPKVATVFSVVTRQSPRNDPHSIPNIAASLSAADRCIVGRT